MTITKVKSRYCVKCDALYKYECVCPNNVRMRNIKKTFQKNQFGKNQNSFGRSWITWRRK